MIRSFDFTFTQGAYGKYTPVSPGLSIRVLASSDNRDLREIRGSLLTADFKVEAVLDKATDIGVIAFMANQKYNKRTGQDADLLAVIEGYIESLTAEDRDKLASLSPLESKESVEQQLIDLFLVRLSIYMMGLAFLSEVEVMNTLPFQFSLPFEAIDGNVLSRGFFDYLAIPIRAIQASGAEGEVVSLIGLMNEFISEWEGLFELGKRYDTAKVTIEVLNGYIGYTTLYISRIKEMADSLTTTLPSKSEMPSGRLERLEKQMDQVVDLLEAKSDPFTIVELASRLSKLEAEVDQLKGKHGRRRQMD